MKERYRFSDYNQYAAFFRDYQDRIVQTLTYCEFDDLGLSKAVYYVYLSPFETRKAA